MNLDFGPAVEATFGPATREALRHARMAKAGLDGARRHGDAKSIRYCATFVAETESALAHALKIEKTGQPSTLAGAVKYASSDALRKSAALRHSTRLAIAKADHALANHQEAKRTGNPLGAAQSRLEMLAAKSELERAAANEKALGAMRGALAKPVRIF
jgi:hypothetical protein